MTEDAFNILVAGIKLGNNEVLRSLQPFQQDCVRMLRIKSGGRCSGDAAYDIFIDAVMDFRDNVLQDKVYYQNVKAYLKQICWYKWMEGTRKRKRQEQQTEEVRRRLYADEVEPEAERLAGGDEQRKQLTMANQALQQLSDKCQRILRMAIMESMSMSDIAMAVGLANANVAKTTKSRCYQQLINHVRRLQQNG